MHIADGWHQERVVIMPHTRTGLFWIRLTGNTANPLGVVIDGSQLPPVDDNDGAIFVLDLPVEIAGITVRGFGFGSAPSSFGVQADFNAFVLLRDCRFYDNGPSATAVATQDGALIEVFDCEIFMNYTGVAGRDRGSVHIGDGVEISGNLIGAEATQGGQVEFDPSAQNLCTIANNQMEAADHSTIRGYSRCSVNNSPCNPAAGDPTARCAP